MAGVGVNNDEGLEREANLMGARASRAGTGKSTTLHGPGQSFPIPQSENQSMRVESSLAAQNIGNGREPLPTIQCMFTSGALMANGFPVEEWGIAINELMGAYNDTDILAKRMTILETIMELLEANDNSRQELGDIFANEFRAEVEATIREQSVDAAMTEVAIDENSNPPHPNIPEDVTGIIESYISGEQEVRRLGEWDDDTLLPNQPRQIDEISNDIADA